MKKILKVIATVLLVVFILFIAVLVGGFIFLKNFDVAKYKPQIIQMASQSLGRPVDFKNIDLKISLNEGIRLHLSDFSVGENPDFGTEPFLTAGEIDAGVDILPFITARQIAVPNIIIRSLSVNIIRNAKETLNAQTIGPSSQEKAPSSSASAALPAVLVNSFKIENAQVHFIDKSTQPEHAISVTQLNLGVRNFSLTNAFDVSLDAAVLSAQTNLRVNGKIQLNLLTQEAEFKDVEGTVDLDQLSLGELKALPVLQGVPIPEVLKGKIKTEIKEGVVSNKGLGSLMMDVSLTGGQILAPDIAPGISLEANHLDFSLNDLSLNKAKPSHVNLTVALYQDQPNVDFKGDLLFDPKTMGIELVNGQFTTDLALWPFEKLRSAIVSLKRAPLPEHLAGKVQVMIKDLQASSAGLQAVLLDAKLSNGEVTLNNIVPGSSLALTKTDLNVQNFSLTKPFLVFLKTAYLSATPDVSFEGNVSYDLNTQAVAMKDAVVNLDLNAFSLEDLKKSGLIPAGTPLPQVLGGKIQTRINNLTASPRGVEQINTDVHWQEGKVAMKEVAPGISFDVPHINVDIKNFELGSPFGFSIALAYLHDEPNINANGTVDLRLEDQTVTLKDTTVAADLSTLDMNRLKNSIAALKGASLPENLQGQFNIVIAQATAGAKGLTSLTSNGSLKGGTVKFKELSVPIQGVDANFSLTQKDFTMDTIKANLGKGQITAQVGLKDYLTLQSFTLSSEFKGIDLAEILDQKQAQVKVAGLIAGNLKAQGQGADVNSIMGDGKLDVTQAKLQDFNVLKTILDKISFLPNVSSQVEAKLPAQYKDKLTSKDTDIKEISATIKIAQGVAVLDPVSVDADEFTFAGKSQAGFDQKYVLDGAFKIPAELSAAMVQGVPELQNLFDENSNISFPVHVSGQGAQPPAIAVTQTAIDMGKNVLRNQGKKQLENILNKALGGSGTTAPTDTQNQQPGTTPQDQSSPASQIIDNIFNKVFK